MNDVDDPADRFMYKLVAMIFSSFEEVLLLDSDNIPLQDPERLFESEAYAKTGSLLWMDFWRGSSAPDCQTILGNATRAGSYVPFIQPPPHPTPPHPHTGHWPPPRLLHSTLFRARSPPLSAHRTADTTTCVYATARAYFQVSASHY